MHKLPICKCMYVYVAMYVCMYACMYVCMHECMYMYMYVCMYVYSICRCQKKSAYLILKIIKSKLIGPIKLAIVKATAWKVNI